MVPVAQWLRDRAFYGAYVAGQLWPAQKHYSMAPLLVLVVELTAESAVARPPASADQLTRSPLDLQVHVSLRRSLPGQVTALQAWTIASPALPG